MSREILNSIIGDFSVDKFERFFRAKNDKLRFPHQSLYIDPQDNFKEAKKLAEGTLPDGQLIVCSFLANQPLSERSGKKAQYELGKKILKETQADAGIFIFYDQEGNFRFSLIYTNYLGKRRDWSNFRRFTYFVSKDQTNKTFLQRIGDGDFSTLGSIKEAFSVEKVTKEFYQEIANWYFWAVKEVKFPEDAEKEENGRNIAVIRLITRMIFIWFMKVLNLIPNDLFNINKIKEILKDVSPNESTYYKAILQNLFFATLNTKQKEREFRTEIRGYKGYNPDFGNHSVYRYHSLFKNPEKMQGYFENIPFLNGGLFDCLDYKSKKKEERFYIDGFTDTKKYQPYVPNFLFFAEERTVDLNQEYGTKGKRYKVRGLINILSSYNFTIDENEPDDFEVALDPELLGRVFENLLASYNPETATTARKATGSYYTPREIVDYMVTQSLINYFKTHLSDISDIDTKLSELFSRENQNNPFDETTTKKLISLIEDLRIVDPAVGSGAFPMGILNKLVFILSKLDPQNTLWKETQIDAVYKNIKDPILQKKIILQIEKQFQEKNPDYGRKLYLIEKCIYGVDIQQIAVEIAKLRFFISLLVDEKIDPNKPNFGIEPLPNLDFKLMQGNSLIEKINPEFLGSTTDFERNNLVNKLRELKDKFFVTADFQQKKDLKNEIGSLINEIIEHDKKVALQKLKSRISSVKGQGKLFYDKKIAEKEEKEISAIEDKIRDMERTILPSPDKHFEWHINFSEVFQEKGGFDIVIANPPYIRQEKIKNQKSVLKDYEVFNSTSDIYTYFYERGWQLLGPYGVLCFISSNKWMRAKYGENLRKFLKDKSEVLTLIDFGGYRVFEATVDTNIILFKKNKPSKAHKIKFVNVKDIKDEDLVPFIEKNQNSILQEALDDRCWTLADEKVLKLKGKIEKIGKPLKEWDVKIYRGVLTGFNEAFIITTEKRDEILRNCKTEEERKRTEEIIKPILRGRDIGRYYYRWAGLWMIKIESGWTNKNRGKEKPDIFFKNTLPSIYSHLVTFKDFKGKGKGLFDRDDQGDYWWELRSCDYYAEFEKEKIVWQEMSNEPSFSMDNKKYYTNQTAYIATGKNLKYIIAMLNSKISHFYLQQLAYSLGEHANRWIKQYVECIFIPPIVSQNQHIAREIEKLVDKILSLTQSEDYLQNPQKQTQVKEYERQIDQLVYKLYGLTEEEIKIVETSVK